MEITDKDIEALEVVMAMRECRPEVARFAREMEMVLRRNDYKGGWDNCDIEYLENRIKEELGEYFSVEPDKTYYSDIKQEEITDVANFCMMIFEYWRQAN